MGGAFSDESSYQSAQNMLQSYAETQSVGHHATKEATDNEAEKYDSISDKESDKKGQGQNGMVPRLLDLVKQKGGHCK